MAVAFQPGAFQSDAFESEHVPVFDGSIFDSNVFDVDTLSVGAQLEVDYGVYGPVGASLETDYLLGAEPVSADLEVDYQTLASLGASLDVSYWIHVGVPVYKDRSTDYLIYNFVSSPNLTVDYAMTSTVGAEFSAIYAIDPKMWKDLTVGYRILAQTVGVEAESDYRILDAAGSDLEVDYAMYGSLIAGSSLGINYAIDAIRDVVIRYDDVDITADLIYRECEFVSQTNGSVGTATVLVRDTAFTHGFVTGRRLELYIGTELMWAGYVAKVGYEYPFSYENLQGSLQSLPRYLRLHASDVNILFERRVTVKRSDPEQLEGPTFRDDHTPDTTAIRALCDNWLDLDGDGIDTVSMVEHVGDINVNQPANPFQAGETWKDAMISIASLPAAVFYITPDRKLVYTDVDTVTNPMILTDKPDDPALGGLGFGYKDPQWQSFGDRLCNDYLAWGTAQSPVVFKRLTDSPSMTLHGRWQDAVVNPTVYKQATINKIADRNLYGSPGSRRGRKDNRESFSCSTFEPGFNVAQKVRVISSVFDFDDVLPIRQMRITFPTPTAPKYDLVLSHEIDVFGFFDVIRYKYKKPTYPDIGEPVPPEPPEPPVPACIALDTFTRTTPMYTYDRDGPLLTTGTWGAGELLTWTGGGQVYVDGSAGVMDVREPMWVDHYSFGGGTVSMSASIPNGVPSNNIVIKFSLGRLEKLVPASQADTTMETSLYAGSVDWSTPEGGIDYDDGAFQMFPWGNLHWNTSATVPPIVYDGHAGINATYVATPQYGPIVRTLFRGDVSTEGFADEGRGGPWHHGGGGFLPGVSLWGSSGGEADGFQYLWWLVPPVGGDGWAPTYWGGVRVSDLFFATPDSSAYIFNQPVKIDFNLGGKVISIYKGPSAFGTTGDGLSRQLFNVGALVDGDGDQYAPQLMIEPGYNYFLRVWRPDGNNVYTKLWQEDLEEPANWSFSGFDATHPPIATVSGAIYYDEQGNVTEWPNGKPTDTPLTNQSISISAQIFTMYQYKVLVDGIWSCDETDDLEIPFADADLPSGSSYSESWGMVDPATGIRTTAPYVPGSLVLHVNGVLQHKGTDYVETDPATGRIDLTFTSVWGDKVEVRYIVQ